MNRRHLLVLALAAPLLASCSDLAPGREELGDEIEAQARIWAAWRPDSYAYVVERLCYCTEEGRGPVRVTVSGTTVVERTYTSGEVAMTQDLGRFFPSVDGLFDVLRDAVERDAHQIQVTWDPVTGAPLDFWIDYEANMADEELGYRIVALPGTP